MFKITNSQLYCLLLLLVAPIAIFEQPHRLIHIAHNNSWICFIGAIVPAMLLVLMFNHIIKKSTQPFPLILYEHLGRVPGFILGTLYILVFILTSSFNLRIFIEFIKTNVFSITPISILIAVFVFLGFISIKIGMDSFVRISELMVIIGVSSILFIVFLAIYSSFHIDRIYPFAYMDYKSFGLGVIIAALILSKMMPILTLAFFIPDKKDSFAIMVKVVITYLILLTLITFAIIVALGSYPALNYIFPTFNMLRHAHLGEVIQNLEIVIVTLFIMGSFGAFTISWFMACYTTQILFNLNDYRFLAAPTTVIVGVLSIAISQNVLEVIVWSMTMILFVFVLFFILIPFILFIICLFKADPTISKLTGEEKDPGFS